MILRTLCILVTFPNLFFAGRSTELSALGPKFREKLPSDVDFLSSVGVTIDCSVYGNPKPAVKWLTSGHQEIQQIPDLLTVLSNDSLRIEAFSSDRYDPRIHATVYRCLARNENGIIVSPTITARAVVSHVYSAQVYDEYVIEGNTAVVKCHIPTFVSDYIKVTAWFRQDHHAIRPSDSTDDRYSVFPNGQLHVRNVQMSDSGQSYRCQTTHVLSGESQLSRSVGRLHVRERKSSVSPSINHSRIKITSSSGASVELPCASQGHPVPENRWLKESGGEKIALNVTSKYKITTSSIIIRKLTLKDSGIYVCIVSNSMGTKLTKTELIVHEGLKVSMDPEIMFADVDKSANFSCQIQGGPITNGNTWYLNGVELDMDVERYRMSSDGSVLHINPVSRNDTGIFQCIVSNSEDSAEASGIMKLGDVAPLVLSGFKSRVLQPGPTVHVRCTFSGDPTPYISWYIDDEEIFKSQTYHVEQRIDGVNGIRSTLDIFGIKPEDGGEYKCVAKNAAGVTEHSARINVYGLPTVRAMKNRTVISGEDVTIKCHAFGYPIDLFTWKKGNEDVQKIKGRMKVAENGSLVITKAESPLDNGQFTCVVGNKHGQTASGSMWINVIARPIISPITIPDNIKEGSEVIVFCALAEGDSPVMFSWLKDGMPLLFRNGLKIQHSSRYSVLSIKPASHEFNGNYTCRAKNAAGIDNKHVWMIVRESPKWVEKPRNMTVVKGTDARLKCDAVGSPTPTIHWKKTKGLERVTINNGSKYQILQAINELVVKSVTNEDSGRYICEADNGIPNTIEAFSILKVGNLPEIKYMKEVIKVRLGRKTAISCDVRGDLPMSIKWRRSEILGEIISQKRFSISEIKLRQRMKSILQIDEVEEMDNGRILCQAENKFGRVSKSIRVIVQDKPDPPSHIQILDYVNKTVEIGWKEPVYDGSSEIIGYQVQYKLESEYWEEAKWKDLATADTKTRIDGILEGMKYNLKVIAINSVGKSEASHVTAFTANANGTIVVETTSNKSVSRTLFKMLLPWIAATIGIIITLLLFLITILIIVRKKSANKNDSNVDRKNNNPNLAKMLLLERNQTANIDGNTYKHYRKALTSGDEESKYINSPKYIYNPTSAYYSEIDISPYATFQIKQVGSIRKSTTELKTFCRHQNYQFEKELSA